MSTFNFFVRDTFRHFTIATPLCASTPLFANMCVFSSPQSVYEANYVFQGASCRYSADSIRNSPQPSTSLLTSVHLAVHLRLAFLLQHIPFRRVVREIYQRFRMDVCLRRIDLQLSDASLAYDILGCQYSSAVQDFVCEKCSRCTTDQVDPAAECWKLGYL